jgi:hypothetical protein
MGFVLTLVAGELESELRWLVEEGLLIFPAAQIALVALYYQVATPGN